MSNVIAHPFPPLYNSKSEILILGSFPSVKSREQKFFYGHPQNRFWRVLGMIYKAPAPETLQEKREFLLAHRIAVWDVIASCEIEGSADSTIRRVIPNNISEILESAPIKRIFVNGKTAEKYFNRYIKPKINKTAVCLPSTSPANAAWTPERLAAAWSVICNI